MVIEEIFSKLLTHMATGLIFHNQSANAYAFLKLNGYWKNQEGHYFEESKNYREFQNFILSHYNKIIQEEKVENLEVIPSNWYKHLSEDVDTNTKREAVRDLFKKWINWETETTELLKESYNELRKLNELYAAEKVLELLKETTDELMAAKNEMIILETVNYDIVFIAERQELLKNEVVL